jgi:hypothetical protein
MVSHLPEFLREGFAEDVVVVNDKDTSVLVRAHDSLLLPSFSLKGVGGCDVSIMAVDERGRKYRSAFAIIEGLYRAQR